MEKFSPCVPLCIGMGDRRIILMVFEVVSVFHLRRKPDQRKGNIIPRGTVGVKAYAIQRLQTGIKQSTAWSL